MLDEISWYVELRDPKSFKGKAFERAARNIEKLDGDIADLVRSRRLYDTPGIGKSIGALIEEMVNTGSSRYLDEMKAEYPPGIFELLNVPGLGLKKIGILHSELGVATLEDLEAAARSGRVAPLAGFGRKTETKILEGIDTARKRESLFLLPTGLEIGEWLRERLTAEKSVAGAEVAGSVRRRLEIIRNVNIVVATRNSAATVRALASIADGLEDAGDQTWRGTLRGEVPVLFHLTETGRFGAALLRMTGSTEFVAALEKRGADLGAKTRNEREVFDNAGIAFVEPERRETADDLRRKRRPKLLKSDDLRGTFHVHSTFSDGRNTIEEMLSAARGRGFDYVGLSDHSKAAYYAGGLTEERVAEQHAEIDRCAPAVAPMRVFRGTEADILPDGSIDYGPDTLSRFDFVIASIHSQFGMPKDAMTERIVRALEDPHVTFLGHLTGRLLLSRDGYSVEFDRIFESAARRGVIIEINGNPRRLDVDWRHLQRAISLGVTFSIHPDAHSIAELRHVVSGTWVARKGGLSAKDVFNSRPLDEVEEYLASRRKRAISQSRPRTARASSARSSSRRR